ncbi:hypothetical protein SDC9_212146 [bioreactor metagenome]|uniref:Uncharacterized protein n=1 Tax=bioreactor metagenome TaxID=1076179 RepID=A0A645JXV5_9ZZZZ
MVSAQGYTVIQGAVPVFFEVGVLVRSSLGRLDIDEFNVAALGQCHPADVTLIVRNINAVDCPYGKHPEAKHRDNSRTGN